MLTTTLQEVVESPSSRFLRVQNDARVAKKAIERAASQAAREGRYEEADDLTRMCLTITRVVNNRRRDLV